MRGNGGNGIFTCISYVFSSKEGGCTRQAVEYPNDVQYKEPGREGHSSEEELRKNRKRSSHKHVSPLEQVLRGILILGSLFFVFQAVQLMIPSRNEPTPIPSPTLPVTTLISDLKQTGTGTSTKTSQPTLTATIPSRTPSRTATPDVVYLLPAENYMPDLPGELSNYSLESEGAMDMTPMRVNAYQALFTNSYPLYHDSDDVFSVLYNLYIFADDDPAGDYYDAFTMDSLVSIYESTYNQRIYPTPIDRVVENIDAIRMFWFYFSGTLKPEIHCQVILIDENLVGQVTIKLFNMGSSATKAISQAIFFTDELINNLK